MGRSTVRCGGGATADGIAKRPQPVADCGVVPGAGAPQIQLDSLTIPGPYKSTETEAAAPATERQRRLPVLNNAIFAANLCPEQCLEQAEVVMGVIRTHCVALLLALRRSPQRCRVESPDVTTGHSEGPNPLYSLQSECLR